MVYFESEVPPAPGVFAGRSDLADGVALQTLDPGTILTLQTHNSTYRLVVLDGARQRVLVTGGFHFPRRTEARVEGATADDSAVKTGWIGLSLKLAFRIDSARVTTSPIQSIDISPPAPSHDPWPDPHATTRY